jgi:mycoredoxin
MTSGEQGFGPLTLYTTKRCGDCKVAKATLDRAGVEYQEIDIDDDASAAETVLAINGGYRSVPTVVLPDGRVLVEPSRATLLTALGLAAATSDRDS